MGLDRIDTTGGSREIITRLRDIEAILEDQSDALASLRQDGLRAYCNSQTSPQSQLSSVMPHAQNMDTAMAETEDLPPLTIPVQHRTSSNYLLTLPAVKSLIGENPPDLFYRLEARSPVPSVLSVENLMPFNPPLPPPDITRNEADELVAAFFATAHSNHPVLNQDVFRDTYNRFMSSTLNTSLESAQCLVVLAIGAVLQSLPDDEHSFCETPPGIMYMQQVLPTLILHSSWSFSSSLVLPQTLVLASLYFAYIVRPLQSWKLIQAASSNLQLKLSAIKTREESPSSKETIIRLFWSCFLIESDRLAELELPRSGLQQLTDSISLPDCTNLGLMQSTCYLAEISIRRLLNRVHNSLYPRKQHFLALSATALTAPEDMSLAEVLSMTSVCDELYSQLQMWHASIPEAFRPSLDVTMSSHGDSDRERILRIRYYAARHIIWRPFVIYIANHGMEGVPNVILDRAMVCLDSCRNYIHNATIVLQRPSVYTWTFSLSYVFPQSSLVSMIQPNSSLVPSERLSY